jgi:hypothetical protein
MKNPFYTIFGALVLLGAGAAQWLGLSTTPVTQVKNVPKSVRENPGIYRSHYGWLPRWFGGK